MTDLRLWLWLTSADGINSQKITRLLEHFGSVEEIYPAEDYSQTEGLDIDSQKGLLNKSFTRAEKILEDCKRFRIRILTFDNPHYPKLLAHIFDPPYVLYVRSNLRIDLNDKLCIAMVGSRRTTEYGQQCAVELGRELARAGIVVVSGMAKGIDGASHRGALAGGGTTVAVLGCGLDRCYPPEHYQLEDAILETGMVLSEYPPGTPPLPGHFPQRNRIISGLCRGTIVVEAPMKSGSLITAGLALEQGRDVFAVPGRMHDKTSVGANSLIKSGAKLIDSALDIIEEYKEEYLALLENAAQRILSGRRQDTEGAAADEPAAQPQVVRPAQSQTLDNSRYEGLTDEERRIIDALSLTPTHIDVLNRKCGIDAAKLNSLLTMMEMRGFIKSQPGKNFVINAE